MREFELTSVSCDRNQKEDEEEEKEEMSDEGESSTWLQDLLQEVQLDGFYTKLRDNLQVTRY